jgi:CRP/FNR family transcriptional activator FtrB
MNCPSGIRSAGGFFNHSLAKVKQEVPMISPELLRRFPFFRQLTPKQLDELAMSAQELHFRNDDAILEQGQPADALYFLVEGCVDLYYCVEESYRPEDCRQVAVCQINPGEPFGISTMIQPRVFTSTARSCGPSRVIQFDAQALAKLFEEDPGLELALMRRMAEAAISRLNATRIQLAAAWS